MAQFMTCDQWARSDAILSSTVAPTSTKTVGSNEVVEGDW